MDATIFYISAAVSLVASVAVATRKNPVYCALFLVMFFPAFSVNFLVLRASFLAVIQVLVYAGAIMVLYLFVIMLLSQDRAHLHVDTSRGRKALAAVFSLALFLGLAHAIHNSPRVQRAPDLAGPIAGAAGAPVAWKQLESNVPLGTTDAIGREFFQSQVLPFELTSVMILIAIIGAIYLTRKRWPAPAADAKGSGRMAAHPLPPPPPAAATGPESKAAVSAAGASR